MKYKLIKKLNWIPEGIVFEHKDWTVNCEGHEDIFSLNTLASYLYLVWINDKDSFEKIEEGILVPDEIKIEMCGCFYINNWRKSLFYINNWRKSLHHNRWDYFIAEACNSYLVKCKLVKTTVWELEAGDVLCDDIDKKNFLNRYCLYLWDYNFVYWEDWIKEDCFIGDVEVYKVVKV